MPAVEGPCGGQSLGAAFELADAHLADLLLYTQVVNREPKDVGGAALSRNEPTDDDLEISIVS
jgi:hypothetical protein